LDVKLYKNDCVTADDLAFINTTSGDELDVELDIIQETITDSIHYQDLNGTAAIIGFCLRVDYNYVDSDGPPSPSTFTRPMSPSSPSTRPTSLTEISADRTLPIARPPTLTAHLEAYICLDDNSGSLTLQPRTGSFLQVRRDRRMSSPKYLEGHSHFRRFSPAVPLPTRDHHQRRRRPLTDIVSQSGICNVKTQLQSKFFTDISGRPPCRRCCHHLLEGLPHAELCWLLYWRTSSSCCSDPRPYHRRRRQSSMAAGEGEYQQ
jgi:hypothetical protein